MGVLLRNFRGELTSWRGVVSVAALAGVAFGFLLTASEVWHGWAFPIAMSLWSFALVVGAWRLAARGPGSVSNDLFDALPDAVVLCDANLDICDCNAAAARMFERRESDLKGRPLDSVLLATRELASMVERQNSSSGKLRMSGVMADPSAPPLEVRWSRLTHAGAPRLLLLISHVSNQLRRQQIYQFLLEGTALSLGRTFFPTLCRRMTEAFHVPVAFIGKFESSEDHRISLLAVCRNGRLQHSLDPLQMDIDWRSAMPGSHLFVPEGFTSQIPDSDWLTENGVESCLAVAIRDDNGDMIGVLGLMDRHPWKDGIDDAAVLSIFAARAAIELQESERYREIESAQVQAQHATNNAATLLSSVGHEIRTLLTSIVGFANYLESTGGDQRQRELAIDAIRRSSAQLLGVVEQAETEAGEEIANASPATAACAPQDIVAKATAAFRPSANRQGIELLPHVAASTPESVETDADAVHQILLNMLQFAASRSPQGRIGIEVAAANGDIEFSVVDDGPPLAIDTLQNLFKTNPEGADYDLPHAQRQARALDGAMDAERRNDGVTMRLTISAVAEQELTVKIPPRFLTDRRLLIVEDGPDNRRLLKFLLEDEGARISLAENGEQGLQAAEKAEQSGQPFDMVLMDMQMPVMDGLEATRRLRGNGFARPIVAVTANALSADRERAMLAGCDEYVSKPVDRDELMARLYLCLQHRNDTRTAMATSRADDQRPSD